MTEQIGPTSLQWIELQRCPALTSELLTANNDECVVAVTYDGIYKYNINDNKWAKIADDNDIDAEPILYYTSTMNKEGQSMYICGYYTFCKFDLIKMTLNILSNNKYHFGHYPSIIDINNKIHIIGGREKVHHFIWNKESKEMNKVYQFKEFDEGLESAKSVYLKSKERILIFGGKPSGLVDSCYNTIHEYSFLTGNWCKLSLILPKEMISFGLISTRFDQFIIILGGYDSKKEDDVNDIFVLNVNDNYKWMKSKIKCPQKHRYNAIITDNPYNDEVLTFDFINNCFKSEEFKNMQLFPNYIIKLISNWVCNENVHLINHDGVHWKINVDDILNELQEL